MNNEPKFIFEKVVGDKERLEAEFSRPVSDENIPLIEKADYYGSPGANEFSQTFGRRFLEDYPPRLGVEFDIKNARLTEEGEAFKEIIQNKDFIDLGCGSPGLSKAPRIIARVFGAKRYIGIDVSKDSLYHFFYKRGQKDELIYNVVDPEKGYAFKNKLGAVKVEKDDGFESIWIQDDMLGFVSKIKATNGAAFLLAGIQEYGMNAESRQASARYFEAMGREMNRITHSGDAVIFSGVLQPEGYDKILEHGFKKHTIEKKDITDIDFSRPVIFIRE